MNVTVIGGGSWGSALARILGDNHHNVIIYDNDNAIVDEINQFHTNVTKLPIGKLPNEVIATNNLEKAIDFANVIVLAVPTKVIRSVIASIAKIINKPVTFVNASKGLEPGTFNRVSEILYQEVPKEYVTSFVALTGPSHAEEVIRQMLTTICAVSNDKDSAKLIQSLFNNNTYFRVYTAYDLMGAELCGAIKNVYAIASGMLEGVGLGDNARAGLISRALVEMKRLLIAFGASTETLYGLTGVGDLIVTCTSHHSRNFQAGVKLATGKNLEETIASMTMVVEGARTTIAVYQFARLHNLSTPIIDGVYHVIYEKMPVRDVIKDLMLRNVKDE